MTDHRGAPHAVPEGNGEPGLRQLLLVEERLQAEVRAAEEAAARRIAAARASAAERVARAREAAAAAADDQARLDREAHDRALQEIHAASRARLQSLAAIPDTRIDELARWALDAVTTGTGEPP